MDGFVFFLRHVSSLKQKKRKRRKRQTAAAFRGRRLTLTYKFFVLKEIVVYP